MISTLQATQIYNRIFLDFLNSYSRTQKAIPISFRALVGELSSADRATHLIHPYPAKLLMHIPFFLLANNILSTKNDIVLDPFAGSGTVLLEAQLSGRAACGADRNPLARLISKVKTTPIPHAKLRRITSSMLRRVKRKPRSSLPDVVNLDYWYYPKTILQLQCVLEAIKTVRDRDVRDFLLIVFSNCVRQVSLADPRIYVPVRLKPNQYDVHHPLYEKTNKRLELLKNINVLDIFSKILEQNIKRMRSYCLLLNNSPEVSIISEDARSLREHETDDAPKIHSISDASIQLIITSPPYPGSQKYIRSSELSLGWLGLSESSELINLKKTMIGREEYSHAETLKSTFTGYSEIDSVLVKIAHKNRIRATIAGTYLLEMKDSLRQFYSILKPSGYIAIVVGNNNICDIPFKTHIYLEKICEDLGLRLRLKLIDQIRSRGLMTKRNSTAGIIPRERVLLFQRV